MGSWLWSCFVHILVEYWVLYDRELFAEKCSAIAAVWAQKEATPLAR